MSANVFQDLEVEPDEPTSLDVEPDAPSAPVAVMAVQLEPMPLPLMQVLPADFQLPALIKFVPDPAIKRAVDDAVSYALTVDVAAPGGLARADLAVSAVSAALKAADAHFDEPAELSNQLHKHITGTRAAWTAAGRSCKDTMGRRIWAENQRIQAEAAEVRRLEQAEANRKAREAAAAEAELARKSHAPAAVVEQLQQKAETAVAPPVPVVDAPKMTANTVVTTWKARLKGTPADAEPNPKMAEITPAQRLTVLEMMAGVIAGTVPITVLEINWSVLNGRAKSDKGTLAITGIEAFADGGVRSKGTRSR